MMRGNKLTGPRADFGGQQSTFCDRRPHIRNNVLAVVLAQIAWQRSLDDVQHAHLVSQSRRCNFHTTIDRGLKAQFRGILRCLLQDTFSQLRVRPVGATSNPNTRESRLDANAPASRGG
jgi:hypothetical protein